MIVADRALGVFLAVAILGFLEREGLVNAADRQQNVEVLGEILSWVITGLIGLVYIIIHKKKHPVVSGDTEIVVTEKRRFSLQPLLNLLARVKLVEKKEPSNFSATTSDSQ